MKRLTPSMESLRWVELRWCSSKLSRLVSPETTHISLGLIGAGIAKNVRKYRSLPVPEMPLPEDLCPKDLQSEERMKYTFFVRFLIIVGTAPLWGREWQHCLDQPLSSTSSRPGSDTCTTGRQPGIQQKLLQLKIVELWPGWLQRRGKIWGRVAKEGQRSWRWRWWRQRWCGQGRAGSRGLWRKTRCYHCLFYRKIRTWE